MHVSWKQRLIRFAHTNRDYGVPARTRWNFPKTVLGRKILLRKTMSQKLDWLSRVKGDVKYDEPLEEHTSFRIGGNADVFIAPSGIEDLKIILSHTQGSPPFILGEGTNLLVKDGGIRGIVVSLKESFKTVGNVYFSKNQEGCEVAVMKVYAREPRQRFFYDFKAELQFHSNRDCGQRVANVMSSRDIRHNAPQFPVAKIDVKTCFHSVVLDISSAKIRLTGQAISDVPLLQFRDQGLYVRFVQAQDGRSVKRKAVQKSQKGLLHPVERFVIIEMFLA